MKKVLLIIVVIFFSVGCVPRIIDCNRYLDPENRTACLKGLEELKAEMKEAEKQAAYNYGRGRDIYTYPYIYSYPSYGYPGYYGGRSCYNYSESQYGRKKSSYYNYNYCY